MIYYERNFDKDNLNIQPNDIVKKRGYLDEWEGSQLFNCKVAQDESGNSALLIESKSINQNIEPLFDVSNKFPSAYEEQIGNTLKIKLPMTLLGDSLNTFPKPDAGKLVALKDSLDKYRPEDFSPVNLHVRLGDVVNLWNAMKYFYPYMEEMKVNWDQVLSSAIERTYTDKDAFDFLKTLQWMVAELKDGHGGVGFSDNSLLTYYYPELALGYIENEVIVTKVISDGLDVKVGDIIVEIDGVSVQSKLAHEEQYISSATEAFSKYITCKYLLKGNGSVKLKLKRQEELYELSIKRTLTRSEYSRFFNNKRPNSISKIDTGIYHIDLSNLLLSDFYKQFEEISESEAIILDMRGYPISEVHQIISHFIQQPDTSRWLWTPQRTLPDKIDGYKKEGLDISPSDKQIDPGKVFFLINRKAMSYPESISSYFEAYDIGTIVGEPTGGTNGDFNLMILPGVYIVNFTGKKVVKHDGSPFHGIGILPDVYVSPTIAGIREGKDEILEKALEIARNRANSVQND